MDDQDSLFGEDEKYPVKGLAYGFFFFGIVMSIVFILLVIDDSSVLLLSSPGGTRLQWPGFLCIIFRLLLHTFH